MLQTIIQSILKSLSGMSCLAVILADASALTGIFMGYHIVKSTQLKDPIMTAIFGSLLLAATFIDIFNQAIGLIFALCYEMKSMLRLYMALTLTVLFIRCSVVFKPPVSGLKSAPFLGRPWSVTNTPYDQMDQDIVRFYSQSLSQARRSSLSTFEVKLRCCGVIAPEDYGTKFARPPSCLPDQAGLQGVGVGSNITTAVRPATNTSGRLAPGSDGDGGITEPPETPTDAGKTTGPPVKKNGSSSDGGTALVSAGQRVLRAGCRTRVWALWEGSKIVFDATVSAITFTIMTALLTVAWCEFWGDGLISGIRCCQEKPVPKAP